jgi:hypothetical protein
MLSAYVHTNSINPVVASRLSQGMAMASSVQLWPFKRLGEAVCLQHPKLTQEATLYSKIRNFTWNSRLGSVMY